MDEEMKRLYVEIDLDVLFQDNDYPKESDSWNAKISKITKFDNVKVASFLMPSLSPSYPKMMIIISPNTTRQNIIDDWTQINEYRNKLIEWSGSLKRPGLALRQNVFRLNRDYRMGYGTIAKFLNFHILVLLMMGLILNSIGEKNDANFYITTLFFGYLKAFGYSEQDAEAYYDEALNELLEKVKMPWKLDSGPFYTSKIRDNIKQLIDQDKEGSLVLKKDVETLRYFCQHDNIVEMLLSLYDESYSISEAEKKLFDRWKEIKIEIEKDYYRNFQDHMFPTPPDMDEINFSRP